MPESKRSSYTGYTEARARANAKYIAQFVEIKVRTTTEHRDKIKAAAAAVGLSVNTYIKQAIDERMTRDSPSAAQTPVESPSRAVSPPGTETPPTPENASSGE